MRKFTPELVKGGKDTPLKESADLKIKTIERSTIEEEKIFTEGEILGLIEQVARVEGILQNHLEIFGKTYDTSGNIITIYVNVAEKKSHGMGWKSIEYDFMIKGNYYNSGFASTSNISRVYNLEDPETSQGGIVAEYIDGRWHLTPGDIMPKATNAKPIIEE